MRALEKLLAQHYEQQFEVATPDESGGKSRHYVAERNSEKEAPSGMSRSGGSVAVSILDPERLPGNPVNVDNHLGLTFHSAFRPMLFICSLATLRLAAI